MEIALLVQTATGLSGFHEQWDPTDMHDTLVAGWLYISTENIEPNIFQQHVKATVAHN